jgi:2-polyprenyl-3-methyl-5-hydroxy-6-metoxy-1,4-benzoquinol methylase
MNPVSRDKAGKAHWDLTWRQTNLPPAINPCAPGLNNRVNREFHRYFTRAFAGMQTHRLDLLEVGCGTSVMLPYLARSFGFRAHGLDYSELGCRKAEEILAREGVPGEIFCADLFDPPAALHGRFDVVFSYGVAEHFEDTAACLRAFKRFIKPGGMIVTVIPNMLGLPGRLQAIIDPRVFDIHVPLSLAALADAHERAGFDQVHAEYFMSINLSAVNMESLRSRWFFEVVSRLRSWVSKAVWIIEDATSLPRPNRVTAPYLNCVGRLPLSREEGDR